MTKKIQLIGIKQIDYMELMEFVSMAPYGYVKKYESLFTRLQQPKIIEVLDEDAKPSGGNVPLKSSPLND